jgi:hypothetical protein
MTGTTGATIAMVSIDCADPGPVADFWAALLGWEEGYRDESYAMLTGPASNLGFGRVEGYEPPAWPDAHGTKQFHLDVATADIAATEARCVGLGAVVPDEQPGEDRWRVLLDPAGHPFCLTLAASWGL